jgi:hypothetical protein
VDREEAIERLPFPYATALRLRAEGVPDETIARSLAIDQDAAVAFFELAEAKLGAIESADHD